MYTLATEGRFEKSLKKSNKSTADNQNPLRSHVLAMSGLTNHSGLSSSVFCLPIETFGLWRILINLGVYLARGGVE